MKAEDLELIRSWCGARSVRRGPVIQTLWSGYGDITRVLLQGCERPSVVVKHVRPPAQTASDRSHQRPPQTASDRSHQRKVRSYQVEAHWYQNYTTGPSCRTPVCLGSTSRGREMMMVLEDLDVAGFDQRKTSVGDREMRVCLRWLAHFHALFLGRNPDGLWPVGTYWHLETRPDELEAMDHPELRAAAADIDRTLSNCRFQTIVHGDAKLANFCFSCSGEEVAAVDFQYVGGGCGMKDVAYFLGSCMEERECEEKVPVLLDYYFTELRRAVGREEGREEVPAVDTVALEAEWRQMFAFSWTDFHRFLLGWSPGHWKIHGYSRRLTEEVFQA
uniref:CHK kinase-like domain-containing protein n=1 Tax=Knipowitschia caucasica TaxID=637954 RepID=A0AAV2MEQ1_KNICA